MAVVREEVPDGGVCTVKAKRLLVAVVGINLSACLSAAFADGGMFFRQVSYEDVLQPTQKVYIRWDGSQEKLLIQTKYKGPAEEMVWIVPVPSEPAVETGDGAVFEEFSEKTYWPDIAHTSFGGSWGRPFNVDLSGVPTFSGGGGETPVEWHRRIGNYDVVLLRPVNGEDVVHWLNTNGYGIPDKAIPILEDYVREKWWMVVSKIHPDALTDITRNKLANGTLHPLEMTFASSACVYPLRLTAMATGPVEELIYLEGPTHYVPQTLSEGDWQIDIFGGPIRQVPQYRYQSDVELAIEVRDGRTKTKVEPHLTKLRRVFQTTEMTQDLIFAPMGYSKWLQNGDPLLIGQAATQYGRHRDPNGIPHLLKALSSGILEQVRPKDSQCQAWPSLSAKILSRDGGSNGYSQWTAYSTPAGSERLLPIGDHVYSSIWALGEIGVACEIGSEAEEMLLQCARHDNQIVRMEAYTALVKLQSEKLGPILADRLAYIPQTGPVSTSAGDRHVDALANEMDMVADWITRFGTASQKEALVNALASPLANLAGPGKYAHVDPPRALPSISDWFEWIVWRAAATRDTRLTAPLQDLCARLTRVHETEAARTFVQRALAACGATDATKSLVRQIGDDEAKVLADGGAPTVEGMTSLGSYYVARYYASTAGSLRVQILRNHWSRYELYPMPSEISDGVLRSALSERELSDWYTLCLLALIKEPQAPDRDRVMRIWEKGDPWLQIVTADVLYAWNDGQTLLALHERATSEDVKSEIAWALADLGVAQGVHIVEERVVRSWNTEWLDSGRPFMMWTSLEDSELDNPKFADAMRKAEAIQVYFRPEWGDLDEARLAALQRLGNNSEIHPGLRFKLFVEDYATKDWAQPLFKKAIRDVLEAHPTSSTVATILFRVDVRFVSDACAEFRSDTSRQSLLIDLLRSGRVAHLPAVQGLLWEVWPQRYIETQGQAVLFREPGDLAASMDYYCQHALYTPIRPRNASGSYTTRPAESALQAIVNDNSLPLGYRAFLLVYWPTAPGLFTKEFVESLLKEDMPDFIREALQKRLLDWRYSL